MTTESITKLKTVRTHPNKTDATQVEVMAGLGTDSEHIADHLSLTLEELQLHYSTQLTNGPKEANLRVAQIFHEMALSGEHPVMTQKWMEMRAGWSTVAPPQVDTTADVEVAKEKLLKLLNRSSAA